MASDSFTATGPGEYRGSAVVVGAGISGLVVARDLARAGVRVTVIEAQAVAGGRLRRAELGDLHIDIGAETFATRGGSVREMLDELHLGDRVVQPARLGAWTVGENYAVPLPEAGALGVPARPLSRSARETLGFFGALRAAIEPLLPRLIGRRSGSLAELVRLRLGRRVLDRLVTPVVRGVYSADPEHLQTAAMPGLGAALASGSSLIAASRKLRDEQSAAGAAVAGIGGGMTVLVDAMLTELERLGVELRTGEGAAALELDPRAVTTERGTQLPADVVVLAVAESVARALLGLPALERAFETPVEVVALRLVDSRLDARPRGTGVLVAEGCSVSAKALTHVTAKWPQLSLPPGEHVLRLSYGRAGRVPETAELSDAAAAELALSDASRLLGIQLRPSNLRGAVRHRWNNGLPPSSEHSIEPREGVMLTGDWVHGSGLASVIPGARSTARDALHYLTTRSTQAARSRAEGVFQ